MSPGIATLGQRFARRVPALFGMREAVGMGLAGIRAYKMRATLTILGVINGVIGSGC